MVEADSHLKPLPPSILDIYKVFEHIDMLSKGVHLQPYTPTLLGSDFGLLRGHMSSQNDAIMSWLRLTATSNNLPHLYWTIYKVFESIDMMSKGIQLQPYEVLPTLLG